MHDGAMMSPAEGAAALDWLPGAATELSRHEADAAAFSNQAVALAVRLAKGGVRPTGEALAPIYASFARHLAAPVTGINLGDFARLAQATQQLWVASGRDMALRPITEQLAMRFGLIAAALKTPLPQFDALFDMVFAPAFKTAEHWEQTTELLRTRMVDPYFKYLERVYPRIAPPVIPVPETRPLRIGYLCWSYETGGSYAIGRVLYSVMRGHALIGAAASEPFLYAQNRCSPTAEAQFAALPGLTRRDLSTVRDPEAAAHVVAADKLDALVVEGFNAFAFRVAQARPTPTQLYMPMGMHPLQAPFFDGYLMYENFGAVPAKMGFPPEATAKLPWRLDMAFLAPARSAEEIAAARASLPPGTTIFGTICRMEKVSEIFMATMARVLEQAPEAGLLIAGPNDNGRVPGFFEARGLGARVRVLGSVDPHPFHHVIDVFADTFPFYGGLAPVEAMAKGVPALHLEGEDITGEHGLRDPALHASNPDQYAALALRLATDRAFLEERRAVARQIATEKADIAATTGTILGTARKLSSRPGR